jgi:hypothetical protein
VEQWSTQVPAHAYPLSGAVLRAPSYDATKLPLLQDYMRACMETMTEPSNRALQERKASLRAGALCAECETGPSEERDVMHLRFLLDGFPGIYDGRICHVVVDPHARRFPLWQAGAGRLHFKCPLSGVVDMQLR